MTELSMKAICKLTGLNPSTLRAWERRYKAVAPRRTPTGRRLYSYQDAERLRLITQLLEEGHAIGTLASLTDDELRQQATQNPKTTPQAAPSRADYILKTILTDLAAYDLRSLTTHLENARQLFDLRSFVLEVVSPLLAEVGKQVSAGKIRIAQEHALSAVLRAQLGQTMQGLSHLHTGPDRQVPRFLFTTPQDELHEFGILIAALLCGYWGLDVCFLGPNLPAVPLAEAARALSADYIVLGTSPLTQRLPEYIRELDAALSDNASEILIGGAAIGGIPAETAHTCRPIDSLQALDQLFKTLAPQAGA
ncbi:MAG: MerR family transcriptional regulator [Bdellovibrionaceae bacterium]|nr:MerR family transcriptional regulator [Bdellovibrionales bacterium]MCB9255081.1 MerR family transcriptional regulator [Pseudobdellovibrionaceae bacterium]